MTKCPKCESTEYHVFSNDNLVYEGSDALIGLMVCKKCGKLFDGKEDTEEDEIELPPRTKQWVEGKRSGEVYEISVKNYMSGKITKDRFNQIIKYCAEVHRADVSEYKRKSRRVI